MASFEAFRDIFNAEFCLKIGLCQNGMLKAMPSSNYGCHGYWSIDYEVTSPTPGQGLVQNAKYMGLPLG
jgi:hypothetical protein